MSGQESQENPIEVNLNIVITPSGPSHPTTEHTDLQNLTERSAAQDSITGAMHCEPLGNSFSCTAVQPGTTDTMWNSVRSEFWMMSFDQQMDIFNGRLLSMSLNHSAQELIANNSGIF